MMFDLVFYFLDLILFKRKLGFKVLEVLFIERDRVC